MIRRVLIVDDDPERATLVAHALARGEFDCQIAATVDDAFELISMGPWVAALVDYSLAPNGSGIEVLQVLADASPRTMRVLYSGYYSQGLAHDAARLAHTHSVMDAGRLDFLLSVCPALEALLSAPSPPVMPGSESDLGDLTGLWVAVSPASRKFLEALRRAAQRRGPVFLYGGPGCGKSLASALVRRWRGESRSTSKGAGLGGGREPVMVEYVPSLRERIQDLPGLSEQFLARHAQRAGEPVKLLAPDALDHLMEREWRGNVRELHHTLLRGWQRVGRSPRIMAVDLPNDLEPPFSPSQSAKDAGQRDCLLRQLRTAGTVSGAARLERSTRTNYIRLMRRLGVRRADTLWLADDEAEAGQT